VPHKFRAKLHMRSERCGLFLKGRGKFPKGYALSDKLQLVVDLPNSRMSTIATS